MSYTHAEQVGSKWLALVSAAALLAGCAYDAKDRCDENEELYADGTRCTCVAGAAMTAHGCMLCGANEVPGSTGCACAAGFVHASPETPCEAQSGALGTACDAQSSPCADATFSHCQITRGTSGYCTNTGCSGAAGCLDGYACDSASAVPYCRRPPVGAGQSCAVAADCAATEATFCDVTITHQCIVQGCALSPDNCFAGTQCCDLSGFGVPQPICVQAGTCPS